jgi:hypothetical protein
MSSKPPYRCPRTDLVAPVGGPPGIPAADDGAGA